MILDLVNEAVRAGARLDRACGMLGLTARTVQRWHSQGGGEDRRYGPKREPANKLSEAEVQRMLAVANSPEFRDVSPKLIVPRLADQGIYIASESSFYRKLREHNMMHHRARSKPPTVHRPNEHVAIGPWQVASWDITYLKSHVRGVFFYLYMVVDVWSRKILGWSVHGQESEILASELVRNIEEKALTAGIDLAGWRLHSDNGSPMKGSTMLATLQQLGVVASFSRPGVSDDNPFSEALFRTMKYWPAYPSSGFATLEDAREWVAQFVSWYNTKHQHSAISYVTPEQRHSGRDVELLANRRRVYEQARRRNPSRWSRHTRNWERVEVVYLNPEKREEAGQQKLAA